MTTKSEIALRVADYCGLTGIQATEAVNAVFHTIGNNLAEGKKVQIAKFGTFTPKETPARMARNPKTGAPVSISPGRKVLFKLAVDLKGRL